ncbi:MAG: hypothetical protein COW32_11270 [Candidatus Aquicultor secundus]|uniref:DUF4367 domain-containing protein n=1 Tax=Candidatus Aquicultor secundus TaxID=1973895 RepID=A0A2M7T8M5_9ACTN|nr:hypothetical protein [Candidatus Aquicultor secundus]NCO66452.1 hypothetical protein [Solirubrobacter sp.]OIO88124.1 MAG: hypothetical protein AUK32_02240 [Candidatus Aquicultor secundus]PIU27801.1 MAG: hypothetical protein COT10_01600 [Candidatus Aquicultor secundus]PIW21191.1 MAG: hypothetical protein COW32_11270 [Candidatus Aquicultor secundus]PIX51794.1 MAG: hypothetical protein COZ51_07680 [Candidatus Aquicultor secundus]
MTNTLVQNKKHIALIVALGILLAALVCIQQLRVQVDKDSAFYQKSSIPKANLSSSLSRGSIQEDIEAHSVKVSSIEEAKKLLSYDFPVPTDTNGHDLIGIYVEDKKVLYLRYKDDIYIVYHQLEGPEPDMNEVLTKRSDVFETTIRGHRAIAGEPGQMKGLGVGEVRAGGQISWFENGLDLAIYSLKGAKVGELKNIAESMK